MTSKTRRVGESLSTATVLALIMPLASLSSEMDSRTTCLNETPPTIECYARVWTVIGVDSVMSLEIRLLFESFAAAILPVTLEPSYVWLILHQLHDIPYELLHSVWGETSRTWWQ